MNLHDSMFDSIPFHRHSTDQGLPPSAPHSHVLDWYSYDRIAIIDALQCNTIIWGMRPALMQQTALSTAVNTLHDMYIGIAKKEKTFICIELLF